MLGFRWFAAEFAVVVSGVVVALALNAAWSRHQDATREQVYLSMLRDDLDRTEEALDEIEAEMVPIHRANGQLVRAFQVMEPPPADSVFEWVRIGSWVAHPKPTTATAQALVATGDLTVIRDDTLRAAVVEYLGQTEALEDDYHTYRSRWARARSELHRAVDYQAVLAARFTQARIDSLARTHGDFPLPTGPRRVRFPFRPSEFFADRAAYDAAVELGESATQFRTMRGRLRVETEKLRARVESEIDTG